MDCRDCSTDTVRVSDNGGVSWRLETRLRVTGAVAQTLLGTRPNGVEVWHCPQCGAVSFVARGHREARLDDLA